MAKTGLRPEHSGQNRFYSTDNIGKLADGNRERNWAKPDYAAEGIEQNRFYICSTDRQPTYIHVVTAVLDYGLNRFYILT